MHLLKGKIQHYAWGGHQYIPALLSINEPGDQPYAEYWLGTHPGGPSRLSINGDQEISLPDFITTDPHKYLGDKVFHQFGELPYLLKVLDVKEMLSIQVHPSKKEAEKGFDRENEAGIPLNAANRNYKDRNHKPEVMIALSEFWLLHGFNPDLENILDRYEWLNTLLPVFEARGIQGLYQYVMELPQEGVDKMLKPLAEKLVPLYETGQLSKNSPDFWAGRVLEASKPKFENLDRGIFSIYFFNVVHLLPGEAIFQAAGVPHAYLEGQNIELMSNSDNVLRAGLTPKYIDVPELLKHTIFEFTHPEILHGIQRGPVTTFNCPVPDFTIDKIQLNEGDRWTNRGSGPEIFIITSGEQEWEGEAGILSKKGDAVFTIPGEAYTVRALSPVVMYKAAVPV
jgi:mannose-6-phosphate isomerase